MRYKNKTTEFEVWQWKGYKHNDKEGLHKFFGENYKNYSYHDDLLVIYTYHNQPLYVAVGDYIVKDVNGCFFPMPKDIFDTLFEEI